MGYIYALIDPIDNQVKYIGLTTTHPLIRLGNHISDLKRGQKTEKKKWLLGLIASWKLPIVKVLKEVKDEEGLNWETYFIDKYRSDGYTLLNKPQGGYRKESPVGKKGKGNFHNIPVIGTNIKTGMKRYFYSASSAARILRSEGIKLQSHNINHQIKGVKNSKGGIRRSAGGYRWEINYKKYKHDDIST